MTDEPFEAIVCGRKIGTAMAWDQLNTFQLTLYGLVRDESYMGPDGDVHIDFECGTIMTRYSNGRIDECVDLIDAIRDCPISKDEEVAEARWEGGLDVKFDSGTLARTIVLQS